MKLLILSFYYQPDLCAGSFRTTALVKELVKKLPKGSTVDVVTTMPNRYASFDAGKGVKEYEQDDLIHIYRIELPSHNSGMVDQAKAFISFYQGAKRYVKKRDYDVVFATSSRLFTAFLGSNIARQKKAPLYLDIRDIFVDTLSDVLSKSVSMFLLPVLKHIENYTFRRANKINLVSEGFAEYFKSRFKSQYSFYSNGIDDEFIQPIKQKAENDGVKTVLYAGNIGEGQGLHKIIPELAKKGVGKFHFKIIGDGGKVGSLKNKVRNANLDNVEVLPPVNRAELVSQYQHADILFMHLNEYAAFEKVLPSKVFEYAALGKPILAGVSGYASQFVKSNVTNAHVFYPCNADEGIAALKSLHFIDKERTEFIQKYKRTQIMSEMATSIIDLGDKES